MKIYKYKGELRNAVNYINAIEEDSIIVGEIQEPTIGVGKYQSLPEKVSSKLDVPAVNLNTPSYTISFNVGDVYITSRVSEMKKLKNTVVNTVLKKSDKYQEYSHSVRSSNGHKVTGIAYGRSLLEIVIWNNNTLNSNNKLLNSELNKNKSNAGISIDEVISSLEEEYNTTAVVKTHFEKTTDIKSVQGVSYSCTTEKPIFHIEEYLDDKEITSKKINSYIEKKKEKEYLINNQDEFIDEYIKKINGTSYRQNRKKELIERCLEDKEKFIQQRINNIEKEIKSIGGLN